MTPFEQFRVWLHRSPVGERVAAGLAAALVVGLLGWLLVPVSQDDSEDAALEVTASAGETTTTTAAGATPTAGDPGAAATTPGSTPAAGPGATSTGGGTTGGGGSVSSAGGGCVSPPGSDQGISATEVKIAITLTNIVGPAGNSTFGVPSVDEQKLDYQLAIDGLNKEGGVACRKLVAQFYPVNPADQSNQQGTCLDIVGTKPFAVIDAGGYYGTAAANCYPQRQLPFFSTGRLTASQRDQFYPYLFATGAYEDLYRNGVLAMKQAGFYSPENGLKKLGLVYRDCWPELIKFVKGLLIQSGVKEGDIVEYSVGCPQGGFANPANIQQAILKFQQNGVTHVTEAYFHQDFANFTKVAQSQGFRPKYGILDDSIIPTTQGNLHVDYDNVEGALIVTSDRYGDESSGIAPSGATQKCDALHRAAGRPPVYQQPVGFGGVACAHITFFATALGKAPSLQRKSLADGLRAARSVDLSYPRGPNDFTAPRTTYGGQFWRLQRFEKACTCWKVSDPAFRPRFA